MKLMLATLVAVGSQASAQEGSVPLDRSECIALLSGADEAKAQAKAFAESVQASFLEAYGPIPVDIDPSQPLVDASVAAWEAYSDALGDLCRDKL